MYGLIIVLKHSLDVDPRTRDPFKLLEASVLSRQLAWMGRNNNGSFVILDLHRYGMYRIHAKNGKIKVFGSPGFVQSVSDDLRYDIGIPDSMIDTIYSKVNIIYVYHGFQTNGRIKRNTPTFLIDSIINRYSNQMPETDINTMGVPTYKMLHRLAYGLRFPRDKTGYVLAAGFVGSPAMISLTRDGTNPILIFPNNSDTTNIYVSSNYVKSKLPGIIDTVIIDPHVVKRGAKIPLKPYEITNKTAVLLATERNRVSLIGREKIVKNLIKRFKNKIGE